MTTLAQSPRMDCAVLTPRATPRQRLCRAALGIFAAMLATACSNVLGLCDLVPADAADEGASHPRPSDASDGATDSATLSDGALGADDDRAVTDTNPDALSAQCDDGASECDDAALGDAGRDEAGGDLSDGGDAGGACPTLSSPTNGNVSVLSRNVGSTAKYTCKNGYQLTGAATRTCRDSGQWSGTAPTCVQDCGAQLVCSGACVDPKTNPDHCGATSCEASDAGSGDGGRSDAGSSDAGAAGTVCSASQACWDSTCVSACPSGFSLCDRECINPSSNNEHCGAWNDCTANPGKACAARASCMNGTCTDCTVFNNLLTTGSVRYVPYDVAIGDLREDGKNDAITAFAENAPRTLIGDNSGLFQALPAITTLSSAIVRQIRLAKINADNHLDVVTEKFFALGKGDGSFGAISSYGWSGTCMAVGDLNRDGHTDILGASPPDSASLILGNGDGTFQAQSVVLVKGCPILADVTNDGRLDVITIAGNVYANRDTGQLQALTPFASAAVNDVAADRLNADAFVDLVACTSTGLSIFLNNSGTAFTAQTPVAMTDGCKHVRLADINGDGITDAVAAAGDTVTVFTGRGDGTLEKHSTLAGATNISAVEIGDVTGDGKPDIVVSSTGDSIFVFVANTRPQCIQ